jgi:hypothetical protein
MMTTTTYPFTDQELQRLASYRAAVAAGFYTDWPREAKPKRARRRPLVSQKRVTSRRLDR